MCTLAEWQWRVIGLLNGALTLGFVLILIGILGFCFPHSLDQLNYWLDWFGAGLTLLGTCAVAFSVWLPPHTRPPARASKTNAVIAIVIVAVLAAWMIYIGQLVNLVVLGVAIIGLAGSLIRMLPFTG
jgi:hypothetical protein